MSENLVLSAKAALKLEFMLLKGDTEVGGFGLMKDPTKLYIDDFIMPKQKCSSVYCEFDDDDLMDLTDRLMKEGYTPNQFHRIWWHTHPGNSPHPSGKDEETFRDVFGACEWAVMAILAKDGSTYARMRWGGGTAPLGITVLAVAKDRASITEKDLALPLGEWHEEYAAKVGKYEYRSQTIGDFSKTRYGEGGIFTSVDGKWVRKEDLINGKGIRTETWDGKGEPPVGWGKRRSSDIGVGSPSKSHDNYGNPTGEYTDWQKEAKLLRLVGEARQGGLSAYLMLFNDVMRQWETVDPYDDQAIEEIVDELWAYDLDAVPKAGDEHGAAESVDEVQARLAELEADFTEEDLTRRAEKAWPDKTVPVVGSDAELVRRAEVGLATIRQISPVVANILSRLKWTVKGREKIDEVIDKLLEAGTEKQIDKIVDRVVRWDMKARTKAPNVEIRDGTETVEYQAVANAARSAAKPRYAEYFE